MSDHAPVLLSLIFVIVAFLMASSRGVVGLLASGLATSAGFATLLAGFHFLPEWGKTYLDVEPTWKFSAGVSAAAAFLVFLVLRVVLNLLFKRLFNRDSPLHAFSDGTGGGLLSLVPSLATVLVFLTCVRVAGTVQELNYIDSLSRARVGEAAGRVPGYPISASWRNSTERLPFLAPALDWVDPLGGREDRNTAAFVLAARGSDLRRHLEDQPETGDLMLLPHWAELSADPGVAEALTKTDRVALVRAPAIRRVASGGEMRHHLVGVDFEEELVDFARSLVAPADPVVDPETTPLP